MNFKDIFKNLNKVMVIKKIYINIYFFMIIKIKKNIRLNSRFG